MPQKKQAAECPRPVKARRLNLNAAVNVFQTDDVVFIQVIAGLNFDKFDVAVGGVFDPVFGFDRNENVFVGLFGQNFVAQGNQSGAFDNDPVFGPVVEQLKRKF